MTHRLYPRLRPSVSGQRFEALHHWSVVELAGLAGAELDDVTYLPAGGTRMSARDLELLRSKILQIASASGYPAAASLDQRNRFDRAVGVELHAHGDMPPGEAAVGSVWAYLAVILLPDVCVWRFPANAQGRLNDDRFLGSDLTRHTLARTWTRAHVLHDARLSRPYELLEVMSEGDLDQVMSRRRSLAASPALVRAVVRCYRDDPEMPDNVSDRLVLRDSLIRLLRMTAFLEAEWHTDAELDELVLKCRRASKAALRP